MVYLFSYILCGEISTYQKKLKYKYQYKCKISIIICSWNLENYQPDNKKTTDICKQMLKTNKEYKLEQRTMENHPSEVNRKSDKKTMELDWTHIM